MTKLQKNLTVLASLVFAVAGCVAPSHALASAVAVSAFTATSTPAYVNTGLATTTRAKVGDTIQYQLTTTGGPSLIAPQINILGTGSTTMTGAGNSWWYATTTTSNAAVWNDGLVAFKVSVGGTTGAEATTTVTAVTSGSATTFDKTGPTLSSVVWNDLDSSTEFSAGDSLVFTFNETMATTTITSGNAVTTLGLSGSHDFGPLPNILWNSAGTVMTMSLASGFTVVSGDTVDPSSAVKDAIGNADATAAPLTITDNLAPGTPTGLADTNFTSFASATLASAGSSQIRFTEDGSTPTCSTGTVYTISLHITGSETVKAVGCDDVGNISAVATGVYSQVSSGGSGGHSRKGGTVAYVPATTGSVADLMAQVAKLQAMLAALTGTTDVGGAGSYGRDLDVGSEGPDVTALQNWLIGKGFAIAAGATGHFGAQTQAALAAWQAANGITPAAGYFGPKTRAAVKGSN